METTPQRKQDCPCFVIFAVAPFLTAGLGWLWLGVKEPWTTLAASLIAMTGVTIMVGGSVAEGNLFGDVFAFGMTLCMAVMMLIIRQHHEKRHLLLPGCGYALPRDARPTGHIRQVWSSIRPAPEVRSALHAAITWAAAV